METEFLKDMREHGRSVISLGEPESGKTFLALKYIQWALDNDLYDIYHCVIPMYGREENDSYKFIENYKNKFYIYKCYDEVVSQRVKNSIEKDKHRVFYFIDDGTSQLMSNMDNTFIELYTTTRHSKVGGVTIWLCVHSAKKVIIPLIRQSTRYYFIYNIENDQLLEGIYKEMLSLRYRREKKKYDDFVSEYGRCVKDVDYGVMLICKKGVDMKVTEWSLLKYVLKGIGAKKKATIKQIEPKKEEARKPEPKINKRGGINFPFIF